MLRLATFNLENLDDQGLANRIAIMKPQLQRINADILCLQEVHAQDVAGNRLLSALDSLLQGTQYAGFNRATTVTTQGGLYKERNLVTLSRFPFADAPQSIRDSSGPRPSYQMVTAIPPDLTADALEWERPILYTQINTGASGVIHVLNVHLKSKIATNIPGQKIDNYTWRTVSGWAEGSFISSMKRLGQALQARMKIDEIFLAGGAQSMIAICGDFNANADEIPIRTICGPVEETGNETHAPFIMIPCENNIPHSSRYSLFHLGKGEMLDHVIVSRALIRFFLGAEIHNESLPDESGAFRTDAKFPESDHAPVIANFSLV